MIKRTKEEEALLGFRTLYHSYGYKRYKMSTFEEYDLYVANKSFLGGDNIVTFSDAGGRLMALRPDVTLSIVKNAAMGEAGLEKLYYNETVYRSVGGALKEIPQVGLECIGQLDGYAMGEVVLLAARSLALVDENYLLTLSHMGIVSALLDEAIPADAHPDAREKLLACIGEKNPHGLRALCAEHGIAADAGERLAALMQLGGSFDEALEGLRGLCVSAAAGEGLRELEEIAGMLALHGCGSRLRLDFSLVNDLQYYNGVIFKGYLRELPTELLSGGRYDRLAQRFGRDGGAIGFAINLGLLERLGGEESEYDVDLLLTYAPECTPMAVAEAVRALSADGRSVRVQPMGAPLGLKYRARMNLSERGLEVNG